MATYTGRDGKSGRTLTPVGKPVLRKVRQRASETFDENVDGDGLEGNGRTRGI